MKHFDSSEDFLDSSEIRSVLNQFEESVKAGSPIFLPANQWINLVYYYQRLQAWNKASQALDLAIAQYPWQAELYSQKALQEKHHNNIPSAIDAIDQALQLQPSETSFFFIKADLCLRTGNVNEAFFWLDDALAYGAEASEVYYEQAQLFAHLGKTKQAIDLHLKAIELGNIDSIHEIDFLLHEVEDSQAVQILKQAIDFQPFDSNIWSMLADRYQIMEKFDDAIDAIDYALAIDDQIFTYHYQKASLLMEVQQYDKAIQVYLDSFHVSAGDIYIWTSIAQCYEKILSYANARKYYRMVINVDDQHEEALLGLAQCLSAEGHYLEAIHYFHSVLDIDNEHFDAWKGLADAEYEIGNSISCFEAFREALRIKPNESSLWTCWATRIFKEGRVKNAMVLLEEAIKQNPEEAILYYQMSAYCFFMNLENRALEYLENGLMLNAHLSSKIYEFYPEYYPSKDVQTIIQSYSWL